MHRKVEKSFFIWKYGFFNENVAEKSLIKVSEEFMYEVQIKRYLVQINQTILSRDKDNNRKKYTKLFSPNKSYMSVTRHIFSSLP